jgi:DNA-binding Lrp family transcriptional regulator
MNANKTQSSLVMAEMVHHFISPNTLNDRMEEMEELGYEYTK